MAISKQKGGMGFRGFSDFNKALLGKQCWRMLTDENSLLGKIFKGRYFPNCSFLEASAGHQPSYAWRSILSARELVHGGSRWAVGNGNKINIWKDNWLPGHSNPKFCSPINTLSESATVSELIDFDLMRWNVNVIQQVFSPYEAGIISSMPLSSRLPEDKLVWPAEKNGIFSVKSAYHILCNTNLSHLPTSSSHSLSKLWKRIWSLHLPTRVRNFIWRLAKNIIPTRGNLRWRGVPLDTICPLCFQDSETTDHLFMNCPLVQQVWFLSPLGARPPPDSDSINWLQTWLESKEVLASQLFCTLLWKIWFFRNQTIFKLLAFDPLTVVSSAQSFVNEFNSVQPQTARKSIRLGQLSWEAPPENFLKMNIDAGCRQDGKVFWGLVIRNHKADVMFAATKETDMVAEPVVAEVLGFRWGLQVATERRLSHVIFELDAQVVVNCFKGISVLSSISPFIRDCHDLYANMADVSVVFTSRYCNEAAHELAQAAKTLGTRTWEGNSENPLVWTLFVFVLFS